mgnify:CR=1 FL=1
MSLKLENVSYIYEKGIGVLQDYEEAYSYYNIAAERNCIKAMIKLGDWYKKGIFLSRNIDLLNGMKRLLIKMELKESKILYKYMKGE